MKLKAQVLHSYDPALVAPTWVTMADVADPKIRKSTDVSVRIGGAGLCRTDLQIIKGIWHPHSDPTGTGLLPLIMGYGENIQNPAVDPIITRAELSELMALADRKRVNFHTEHHKLSDANQALKDLHHGKIKGRAVLIP